MHQRRIVRTLTIPSVATCEQCPWAFQSLVVLSVQHGCFTGSLNLLDDEKIDETCTSMQSTEFPVRTDISVEEMQGWLEAIYTLNYYIDFRGLLDVRLKIVKYIYTSLLHPASFFCQAQVRKGSGRIITFNVMQHKSFECSSCPVMTWWKHSKLLYLVPWFCYAAIVSLARQEWNAAILLKITVIFSLGIVGY